jgi:hypothetical protein
MRSSSCKETTRQARRGPALRNATLACLALAALAWSATDAGAITFYKWTDKSGQTHYADAPPKGVDATRVDVDPGAHSVAPPASAKRSAEERTTLPAAQPDDYLKQRRETRDRLEANLAAARERLDLARAALAEGAEPQEDEWQVTASRQMGSGPQVPRSNCRTVAGGGVVCPGRVPSEGYYQRLDRLQQDVQAAELAVEEAERAYRRGVD